MIRWRDFGWMIFGGILVAALLIIEQLPNRFYFVPKLMVLMYVSSAVLSYVLGAQLKKTYLLSKEPAKFFFALGLQGMGVFWFAAAALTPQTQSLQSGMFLWSPYVGLIFATVLFLGGILPRSKATSDYLYKHYQDIQEIVTATIVALSLLLITGPWGIRGMTIFEEGSFPGGEFILLGLLTMVVILIFALQYYSDSFKGFSYDSLSRGLLFLTVAQYGLLIKQPWSTPWWVLHIGAYLTLCILSYSIRAEIATHTRIQESVSQWSPSIVQMPVAKPKKIKKVSEWKIS